MVGEDKENVDVKTTKHKPVKETESMEKSRTDLEYFDEQLTKLDDEKVKKKTKPTVTINSRKRTPLFQSNAGNISILELATDDNDRAHQDSDDDQFDKNPPARKPRKRKGQKLILPKKKKKKEKKEVTSLDQLIESKKVDGEDDIREMADISRLKETSQDLSLIHI